MSKSMTIYHLSDDAATYESIVVEYEGSEIATIFQSYYSPEESLMDMGLVDKIKEIAEYAQSTEFIRVKYMTFEEYERRNDE